MRPFVAAWQRFASLALLAVSAGLLDACSGAVSAPPATPTPSAISITPSTATVYSNLPSTFVVTGGNGNYIVNSSNQAIVPSILSLTSNGFTVVPNDVGADTPVTLTVQDTAGNASATATLTVKPRTISNVVTITPSASQSAACGTAICSGGDASVSALLSQAGVPLAGRQVQFDVISGDFRVITSAPGTPEALSLSGSTSTDATGTATMRIRVLSDAGAQTGLLQITDVASGFTQRVVVNMAPSSNAPLNAQPSTIVFQGVAANTCASGISADVIVFGGRPPYLISQPGSFTVSPTLVTNSGGRFTVAATGQCTAGSQIAVVDSNGATVSVTASNALSDVKPPTATPFSVSPTQLTLDCKETGNVLIVGGVGPYIYASNNSAFTVSISNNTASITLSGTGTGPITTAATIAFSDGQSSVTVKVNPGPTAIGAGC